MGQELFFCDRGANLHMGRHCKIEELVGAYIFLASPASSYITGTTLMVDGGYTAL